MIRDRWHSCIRRRWSAEQSLIRAHSSLPPPHPSRPRLALPLDLSLAVHTLAIFFALSFDVSPLAARMTKARLASSQHHQLCMQSSPCGLAISRLLARRSSRCRVWRSPARACGEGTTQRAHLARVCSDDIATGGLEMAVHDLRAQHRVPACYSGGSKGLITTSSRS